MVTYDIAVVPKNASFMDYTCEIMHERYDSIALKVQKWEVPLYQKELMAEDKFYAYIDLVNGEVKFSHSYTADPSLGTSYPQSFFDFNQQKDGRYMYDATDGAEGSLVAGLITLVEHYIESGFIDTDSMEFTSVYVLKAYKEVKEVLKAIEESKGHLKQAVKDNDQKEIEAWRTTLDSNIEEYSECWNVYFMEVLSILPHVLYFIKNLHTTSKTLAKLYASNDKYHVIAVKKGFHFLMGYGRQEGLEPSDLMSGYGTKIETKQQLHANYKSVIESVRQKSGNKEAIGFMFSKDTYPCNFDALLFTQLLS